MSIHDIKVGYSCNNNCLHCVIADNRDGLRQGRRPVDLSTQACMGLLRRARRRGATAVVLTGGEPSIRPDFIDILAAAERLNFDVEIQTNGRAFHAKGLCPCIPNPGRTQVWVALHGPTAELHDRITRRSGSFRDTLQGMRNLMARGCSVRGKVVISKLNQAHLTRTLSVLHRLGIRRATFAFPHAVGNARIHFARVVPRYADLRPRLVELIQKAARLGMRVDLEAVPFCILPQHPEAISDLLFLSGKKHVFTPVGEPSADWGKVRKSIRRKAPQCRSCCYDRICEGPWMEYIERFGSDELQPVAFDARAFERLMGRLMSLQG